MPESSDTKRKLSLSRTQIILVIIVVFLILLAAAFFFVGLKQALQQDPTRTLGPTIVDLLSANVFSEVLSIAITVFILNQIYEQQEDRKREADQAEAAELQRALEKSAQDYIDEAMAQQRQIQQEERRQQLIDQMSSRVEGFAAEAIRLLKDHDKYLPEDAPDEDRWWDDQLVVEAVDCGANLAFAELSGVCLRGADLIAAKLRKSDLWEAHLEDAALSGANLEGADLSDACLQGADLSRTHLENADLWNTHLEGANFTRTRLTDADLLNAHLDGAKNVTIQMLRSAKLLNGATLPDGTKLPHIAELRSTAFEEWCKTVPVDEDGYIIPAPPDDEAE